MESGRGVWSIRSKVGGAYHREGQKRAYNRQGQNGMGRMIYDTCVTWAGRIIGVVGLLF